MIGIIKAPEYVEYNWQAIVVFLATLVGLTKVGSAIAFRVPAFAHMRDLNREADRTKLRRKPFREAVKRNNLPGLAVNVAFYVAVLPFFLSLDPRPVWRHAAEIFAVLMVYDFFYYLTHRFLFHGRPLRRIHALHHQVHHPTYIDALYVHPVETAIGLTLFLGTIPLIAVSIGGGSLSAFSMAIATLLFTQLNQINHTFIDLPRFPFRTLDRITSIHAAHHADMNRGNFATLTMIYDRIFGTLEEPISRSTP